MLKRARPIQEIIEDTGLTEEEIQLCKNNFPKVSKDLPHLKSTSEVFL